MKFITDEGIILKNQPFGESDNIVSIFTRHHGRLTCIAKGAKRSKKRFGVNIQPTSLSLFKLCDKGVNILLRIDSCDLIKFWKNLIESMDSFIYSQYGLELIYRLLPEREENTKVFELLVEYFESLNERGAEQLLVRRFESKLITLLGYRPHLTRCAHCGVEDISCLTLFNPEEGRVYCKKCAGEVRGIKITSELINLFYHLVDCEFTTEIEYSSGAMDGLRAIIWALIMHINEAPINSWQLMR